MVGSDSGKKAWEFLVYLAGDNNLSEEMVWALQEMAQAASQEGVHERIDLVALFDPAGGEPLRYDLAALRETAKTGGGLALAGVQDPSLLMSEEVHELVERFLMDGFGEPPRTTNRGVILSGHGSGALGDFLADRHPEGGALSIPALGRILGEVKTSSGSEIEILGLDSCQMSTIEVGYEVRESVRYLVASEGPVSTTGWPYRQVLEALADSAGEPKTAACAIADRYLAYYRDYEIAPLATDISVTDLAALDRVARGVRDLASAMSEPLKRIAADGMEELSEMAELEAPKRRAERSIRNAIVLAHWSAQSYKCDRYSDLYDFAQQLLRFLDAEGRDADRIRECSRSLLTTIKDAAVSGVTGFDLQHSHGLSIYFPWCFRDFLTEYGNLRFAKDTGWVDFLEVYLGATERMRRFQSRHMDGSEPAEPRRDPSVAPLAAGAEGSRDAEAGTRKDAEAGTRKGKACRSTMKNPPDGYYPSTGSLDRE